MQSFISAFFYWLFYMDNTNVTLPPSTQKPHYHILDGLRGVAALMVLIYHFFEAFGPNPYEMNCNHGFLAVPFFFVLSGFVIGYAYDDRWKRKTMTTFDFIKRRIIRLHPMVVIGVLLGVTSFLIQGSVKWDGTEVSLSSVLLAGCSTLLMLPAIPESIIEIRGFGEIFPLNGPLWSLFVEYIGSFLYAILLRHLSTRWLGGLSLVSGIGVATYAIGNGSGFHNLGVGWTMNDGLLWAGLLVMTFCFSFGLLMARIFRPIRLRGAFWLCAVAIIVLTAMPYVGGKANAIWNGVYEAVCVVILFPAIVWLGASGVTTDKRSTAICQFCGAVSYPVYVIHYPSMYLFYAWVWKHSVPLTEAWYIGAGVIVGNILLAYFLLKIYDEPVRKWLSQRFLK